MNDIWLIVIACLGTTLFLAATLAAIYEIFIRYPAAVRQRLRDLSGKSSGAKHVSLLNVKHLADSASNAPSNWRAWADELLEQSGARLDLRTLLFVSLAAAGLAGLLTGLALPRWWSVAGGVFTAFALPWLFIEMQRRLRIRKLTRQLPDAMDVMCRAVRAGQTVPASIQMVADDFAPPIADEFRHCYEQQNLGISYDVALRNLARRTGIMELRILVVALLVQARSGGSLTDLMQNLSSMVRKRLVLQQKVKALTGEGRMQAVVLIALPFLVFLAMYFLNREYAQILLDRPWLLAGCVGSQTLGAVIIRKLIQIDY